MVPPLDPMTSPVKVIWPDGHTCIIGPWPEECRQCPKGRRYRYWGLCNWRKREPLRTRDTGTGLWVSLLTDQALYLDRDTPNNILEDYNRLSNARNDPGRAVYIRDSNKNCTCLHCDTLFFRIDDSAWASKTKSSRHTLNICLLILKGVQVPVH